MGGLILAAVLLAQIGSYMFLNGEARRRDNFPIAEVNAWIHQRAGAGDMAVVHHSWYLPFFNRYYPHRHPRFIGAVTEGILPLPFGGVRRPTTPPDVAEVMRRVRDAGSVFLVLSTTANQEWRDPRGLMQAGLDLRLEFVDEACFSCTPDGFPTLVRRYRKPQKR